MLRTVPMRHAGGAGGATDVAGCTPTGAASRTRTWLPGRSPWIVPGCQTTVWLVMRSTRLSWSVIVPVVASTCATTPVASTVEPGRGALAIGAGGTVEPATWMLLTMPLTPLTEPAI